MVGSGAVGPAVVAQRMCDTLLSFPTAATCGVQWQTLVRKCQDRYSMPLDIAALGHESALSASTFLLWDVLRLVNSEDTDNPIVAIEDAVAMTPRPGFLATWPSLYKSFCEVVQSHGTLETETQCGVASRTLLLSQLKPLLQSHWHGNFSECGLNYLTEEGNCVQLKKMKHLVQAVLRWRDQYLSDTAGMPEVAAALAPRLELAPSKTRNDLVLQMMPILAPLQEDIGPLQENTATLQENTTSTTKDPVPAPAIPFQLATQRQSWADVSEMESEADFELNFSSRSCSSMSITSSRDRSSSVDALERELAELRAENAELRNKNEQLQETTNGAEMFNRLFFTPSTRQSFTEPETFDDPFEPPMQKPFFHMGFSPCGSTATPSEFSYGAGSFTPISAVTSGTVTPLQCQGGFGLVPMWYPIADLTRIPSGIVQQAKAVFERSDASVPSFFAQR